MQVRDGVVLPGSECPRGVLDSRACMAMLPQSGFRTPFSGRPPLLRLKNEKKYLGLNGTKISVYPGADRLTLPYGQANRHRTMGPTDHSALPATVLVVDDEELLRRLLSRMLVEAGFAVIEADNGEVALEAARRIDGALRSCSSPDGISPVARTGRCPPDSSCGSLFEPRHFSPRFPSWLPARQRLSTHRSGACISGNWTSSHCGKLPTQ
jgi:hypothetical protein